MTKRANSSRASSCCAKDRAPPPMRSSHLQMGSWRATNACISSSSSTRSLKQLRAKSCGAILKNARRHAQQNKNDDVAQNEQLSRLVRRVCLLIMQLDKFLRTNLASQLILFQEEDDM